MNHDVKVNQTLSSLSAVAGADLLNADFWVAVRDANRKPRYLHLDTRSNKHTAEIEARHARLERKGGQDLLRAVSASESARIFELADEMAWAAETHPEKLQGYQEVLRTKIITFANEHGL